MKRETRKGRQGWTRFYRATGNFISYWRHRLCFSLSFFVVAFDPFLFTSSLPYSSKDVSLLLPSSDHPLSLFLNWFVQNTKIITLYQGYILCVYPKWCSWTGTFSLVIQNYWGRDSCISFCFARKKKQIVLLVLLHNWLEKSTGSLYWDVTSNASVFFCLLDIHDWPRQSNNESANVIFTHFACLIMISPPSLTSWVFMKNKKWQRKRLFFSVRDCSRWVVCPVYFSHKRKECWYWTIFVTSSFSDVENGVMMILKIGRDGTLHDWIDLSMKILSLSLLPSSFTLCFSYYDSRHTGLRYVTPFLPQSLLQSLLRSTLLPLLPLLSFNFLFLWMNIPASSI